MRVIRKKVGEPPRWAWVENTLEALQKEVGGYIETVTICTDLVLVCDEEGRLKGKPHNCTFLGCDFVGDLLIVGTDGKQFTDCPLEVMRRINGTETTM